MAELSDQQVRAAYDASLSLSSQAPFLPSNFEDMDGSAREAALFMLINECLQRITNLEQRLDTLESA